MGGLILFWCPIRICDAAPQPRSADLDTVLPEQRTRTNLPAPPERINAFQVGALQKWLKKFVDRLLTVLCGTGSVGAAIKNSAAA
jgi:hypothetical protein